MLDGMTEQEGMWRISQLGVYITAYDVVMVMNYSTIKTNWKTIQSFIVKSNYQPFKHINALVMIF